MATRNSYQAYKRDTSRLIYWIVKTSNAIIKRVDGFEFPVNTSGEITRSSFISLASLIAKHIDETPPTIMRLFRSVIYARLDFHAVFLEIAGKNPSPEMEQSNAAHKSFIDTLNTAFHVLGGDSWMKAESDARGKKPNERELPSDTQDDLDRLLLANKFSLLDLDETHATESEKEASAEATARSHKSHVRKAKNGKKAKRGKTAKGRRDKSAADEVPIRSYRIIIDEKGAFTEYIIAVMSLVKEWTYLREFIQAGWEGAAYDNLHTVQVGCVSNMAIKMLQRSESALSIEFPELDSYEALMRATNFVVLQEKSTGCGTTRQASSSEDIDTSDNGEEDRQIDWLREQFMFYTFVDLMSFLDDFQKTRSGKPTKRMLKQISDWDPNFDLQEASRSDRILWRRAYTINWLYDLVNLYSSPVMLKIRAQGNNNNQALDDIDWSVSGPCGEQRRLFGLNEFASVITNLAMQKEGTNVCNKILPHQLFQLQLIVDSMAATRGWKTTSRKHLLRDPPADFLPRRDIDQFLHANKEKSGRGFLEGASMLQFELEYDAYLCRNPHLYQGIHDLVGDVRENFRDWLGQSQFIHVVPSATSIPPSRFSQTNENGLWEYSPFLCGVGLMEALEIANRLGMQLWDRFPEVTLLMHLHNMLVQKGYLKERNHLFHCLETQWGKEFFGHSKKPTADSDFQRALMAHLGPRKLNKPGTIRPRKMTINSIHDILGSGLEIFQKKSALVTYRRANWDPERIPDDDVPVQWMLMMVRVAQTPLVVDRATGVSRIKETDLVKRVAEVGGVDDEWLDFTTSMWRRKDSRNAASDWSRVEGGPLGLNMGGTELLKFLAMDIERDVRGDEPLSGFNYVYATAMFMNLFHEIEHELSKAQSPTLALAKKYGAIFTPLFRLELVYHALSERDEKSLEIIAAVFERHQAHGFEHIYWGRLERLFDEETMALLDILDPAKQGLSGAETKAMLQKLIPRQMGQEEKPRPAVKIVLGT